MLLKTLLINLTYLCFVVSMYVVHPGPLYPPTKGEVWPKPQLQTKHNNYFKLPTSDFQFTKIGETCQILTSAIERYANILRSTNHVTRTHLRKIWQHVKNQSNITGPYFLGPIQEIKINLTAPCEEYPKMEIIESYELNVATVSNLTSNSIWGILRGLETFAQLFYISDDYKNVLINATEIRDSPRYQHRGLHIDTSRHFISVSNILKTLDAMEMNKMNVLHWHIVDDQSFPYQSERFPQLSEQGAYHPTMIYSKKDIEQIVNYARDRGIRVLPEFDIPGHTRSWGVAYPNILTKCYQFGVMIGLGPMDPTNNMTYKLINELFQEVQERFPDSYFHVGGDEVELHCWQSNPAILQFMKEHNISSARGLHGYFMNRVIPLLGVKSKPIVWQEVFDESVPLPSDAIVQVWKNTDPHEMIRILQAGHKLIYSSSWYLSVLSSGGDWVKFYKADPRQMISDKLNVNKDNIVGGEACMWAEVVDDTNIISRVWPRASAVAEKLWSPETHGSPAREVYHRIEEHACRMNRRGISAQPPSGPGFCLVG